MTTASRGERREVTAMVKRQEAGWVAHSVDLRGAVGIGRRLDQAVAAFETEAAAALGIEISELQVRLDYDLGDAELLAVNEVREYQAELADAQRNYMEAVSRAVRILRYAGFTDRDSAYLLGLSHQRIFQIRTSSGPEQRPDH